MRAMSDLGSYRSGRNIARCVPLHAAPAVSDEQGAIQRLRPLSNILSRDLDGTIVICICLRPYWVVLQHAPHEELGYCL